jgi:uncharacterized phosphatase
MIYVIRHGQTDLNLEGRLQGRQGVPLNETGVRQAEALRSKLAPIRFEAVFSSPQERAEIATGQMATIDARLDVFDLGEAEGLKKSEVKLAGAIPDPHVYQGVEDVKAYASRIFAFMEDLEREYGARDVHVLVSGHRCTTGCIGAYFLGMPEDGNILRFSSDNGDYSRYEFQRSNDPK